MKYRIETQQVFGLAGSGVAYDRNAEWAQHADKPRGLTQAKAMMQARFDNNGFKPPIRVVAVNALGDKRVMAQIDSPHRFGHTQSFFDLHAMHFRAVDECIQEGRPFSFAEGTDHTGKPSPRNTHNYTAKTEEKPTMAVLNDMEQEARAMLHDSRDYHTLDGAFLLVRDGNAVWLCRQSEGFGAVGGRERLLCVATREPVDHAYYLVRVGADRYDMRQTRYKAQLAEGREHPHDICATHFDSAGIIELVKTHKFDCDLSLLDADHEAHVDRCLAACKPAHESETDDDTDFDVWVSEVADNLLTRPDYRNMATRFIELEKLLDSSLVEPGLSDDNETAPGDGGAFFV